MMFDNIVGTAIVNVVAALFLFQQIAGINACGILFCVSVSQCWNCF